MTNKKNQYLIAASFLSILLMYIIFIRPHKLELIHQQELFEQLTTSLQNKRAFIGQQKTISTEINELKLRTPSNTYKKTREKTDLLAELANQNHLESFQISAKEPNKPKLSAQGRYHSIITFLKQVHDAHLGLLIKEYHLEAIPGSHQLKLTLYLFNATHEKS